MINYGFGVALGPLSLLDSEKMRAWRNDPRIFKWTRQHSPLETWDHKAWLESLPAKKDIKMFTILSLQQVPADVAWQRDESPLAKPVGVCGLTGIDLVNRHAEFSIYVGPEHWGERLGKKALQTLCQYGFSVLGLNHIFGETFEGNHARATFEEVGFKHEGSRRKFYFRNGKYIDARLYSILAEEFKCNSSS